MTGSLALFSDPVVIANFASRSDKASAHQESSFAQSFVSEHTSEARSLTISSSPADGGFFYTEAVINGVPIRLMVDTGANTMVLREADAKRAGLPMLDGLRLRTVGGSKQASKTRVAKLTVGEIGLTGIDAVVVGDNLETSLIGIDTLAQLGPIILDGNRLTISAQSGH